MEGFEIYLYDKNGKQIGIYLAPSREEFEADKLKYCSEYVEGENYISFIEIKNPIIENNEVREMTLLEKIQAGILILADGQYLEHGEIKTVEKPNPYSKWDKKNNTWIEDKTEKLQYLKDERYSKQKEFVDLKKKLSELEDEKTEFEELGFPTDQTEANITETSEKMDNLKKEIAALTKEIKKVEKEVV